MDRRRRPRRVRSRSRSPPTTLCAACPTTVLTPHLGYVTDDCYRIFYDHIVEDIAAWLKGQPVRVLAAPDTA